MARVHFPLLLEVAAGETMAMGPAGMVCAGSEDMVKWVLLKETSTEAEAKDTSGKVTVKVTVSPDTSAEAERDSAA